MMCRDGESTRQHLIAFSEQYLRRRTVDGYAGGSAEDLAAEQKQPFSSGANFGKQGLPNSDAGLSEHPATYNIKVWRSSTAADMLGEVLDSSGVGLRSCMPSCFWLPPHLTVRAAPKAALILDLNLNSFVIFGCVPCTGWQYR